MTRSISNRLMLAAVAVFASVGTLFSASFAHAQIAYESQLATTTALFQEVGGDLLQTALIILGIVLGIAVLIFGVKWGWKKLKGMGMRG